MVLQKRVQMGQLIGIVSDWANYAVGYEPVLLDKAALVYKISAEGKTYHKGVQKFVWEFCETQYDVAASRPHYVFWVVEKTNWLPKQRKGSISLYIIAITLLKKTLRFWLLIFRDNTLRKLM